MSVADIERAARTPGVKFVKLKLRKLGSLERLVEAIKRIREVGLSVVLGDGTSTEIHCWMEACVARLGLETPGQMNGFLKIRNNLFLDPLRFEHGHIWLSPGFWAELDRDVLGRYTIREERWT